MHIIVLRWDVLSHVHELLRMVKLTDINNNESCDIILKICLGANQEQVNPVLGMCMLIDKVFTVSEHETSCLLKLI